MRKTLIIIACLIAFSCAMRSWQFIFPPRIFIFDLLSIFFVFGAVLYYSLSRKVILIPKELKYFISLQYLYLLIVGISGLKVAYWPTGEGAVPQFYKGIFSLSFHTLFFSLFVFFLSDISSSDRNNVLRFYIAGVICSCLYGMLQMAIWKNYGIDIGPYIWDHISYGTKSTFDIAPTWTVMGFTRGQGFPGVAAGATYVVTILPLLFLWASFRRNFKVILLLIISVFGLFLTMSRTGIFSFALALLLLSFSNINQLFRFAKTVFILSAPLGFVAYVGWKYIIEILKYRALIDYSRLAIYEGGIQLFKENILLGVGANNYSVARFSLPSARATG